MNTNNRVQPPPRHCCTKAAGQRRHRLCPGAAAGARRAVPRAGGREPSGRGIPDHSCRQHLPREQLRNFPGQKHPGKVSFLPPPSGRRQVSRRAGEGRGRGGRAGAAVRQSGPGGGTRLSSLPGGLGAAQECTRGGCWAEVSFVFDL